jgi:hypothetical protein
MKTHHFFGANLPVFLDIPKTEGTNGGSGRLRQPKIGILEKGERKFVVLTDGHQCPGRIQTLRIGKLR